MFLEFQKLKKFDYNFTQRYRGISQNAEQQQKSMYCII